LSVTRRFQARFGNSAYGPGKKFAKKKRQQFVQVSLLQHSAEDISGFDNQMFLDDHGPGAVPDSSMKLFSFLRCVPSSVQGVNLDLCF